MRTRMTDELGKEMDDEVFLTELERNPMHSNPIIDQSIF